ncbi:MAG TPA: response regulator [Anaerolineae bacterium]|nr:response regulator [Anaerolineae bacterium]HQK15128.1 response regulator [Anaerolineae bacterium]
MDEEIKVLLVDDEKLVLRSMEKSLLRAGFDVESAGNASDALALFQQAREEGVPFDIAILDLNMPNLEGQEDPNAGLQLLSKLLEVQPDFAVVVLTAFDEVERAKEAVRRGARAYFVKGREADLIALVESIVQA